MDELPVRGPGARALVSGTALLFACRLLAAGLALFQTVLLARLFGTSSSTDAYFVASSVSLMFAGPIEAVLNLAFQPVFVHSVESEGQAAAWRIAAGLFRVGLVITGTLSLVIIALSAWIAPMVAPGFDRAAMAQATQIIRITAPIIFVIYAASFLASIEFIEGRSALPSLAMIVSGVGGPLGLIWFADRLGVAALAWGALASAVARLLLLMRPRHLRHLLGPGVSVRDPIMRRMAGMMLSRLTTSLFLEMNLLVDRIFASFLGPGYISALTYASRGVVVIVRIFMMPMGRMLLPWMSRLAARQQYERMRALVEKLVIATTSLLVPLVAFIVAFRTELLGIVFGRGAFDRGSVEATSVALLYFALGIIPFLVAPMLSAVFFSLQDSATPLRTGLVCVAANAALDGILVVWMGHGGIALSTSLTGLLRAYLLWVYLRRRLGSLQSRAVLGSLVVSGATAVVAFWSARLLMFLAGPGWVKPVWQLAAYALIGGAGYLVLQNIFNRPVARLIPAVLGRLAAERS